MFANDMEHRSIRDIDRAVRIIIKDEAIREITPMDEKMYSEPSFPICQPMYGREDTKQVRQDIATDVRPLMPVYLHSLLQRILLTC